MDTFPPDFTVTLDHFGFSALDGDAHGFQGFSVFRPSFNYVSFSPFPAGFSNSDSVDLPVLFLRELILLFLFIEPAAGQETPVPRLTPKSPFNRKSPFFFFFIPSAAQNCSISFSP